MNLPKLRPSLSRAEIELLRSALRSLPVQPDSLQEYSRHSLIIQLDKLAITYDLASLKITSQQVSMAPIPAAKQPVISRELDRLSDVVYEAYERLGFTNLSVAEQDLIIERVVKELPESDWSDTMRTSFNRVMTAKLNGETKSSDIAKLRDAGRNVGSAEDL